MLLLRGAALDAGLPVRRLVTLRSVSPGVRTSTTRLRLRVRHGLTLMPFRAHDL